MGLSIDYVLDMSSQEMVLVLHSFTITINVYSLNDLSQALSRQTKWTDYLPTNTIEIRLLCTNMRYDE